MRSTLKKISMNSGGQQLSQELTDKSDDFGKEI